MKNKKYLTQEEANEYDAHAEFEKRNFINEIRYKEGYYDNDEEIRYSEARWRVLLEQRHVRSLCKAS